MEIGSRVRRRTAALVLTSAVSLLGGAACSSAPMGDADPATGAVLPAGPASAASSATPSPSTTTRTVAAVAGPAPLPAMARARTRKGAEAFVRHFLAEYNRAVTTPVAGLLDPLSLSSCKSCAAFEARALSLIRQSQKFGAKPVRNRYVHGVGSSSSTDVDFNDPIFFVEALPEDQRVPVVDASGRAVSWIPGGEGAVEFELHWVARSWRVARIRGVERS